MSYLVLTRLVLLMEDPVVQRRARTAAIAVLVVGISALAVWWWTRRAVPGRMPDEAAQARYTDFNAPSEDYFHAMDGGADLATDQVRGRNLWMVASGGNDRFWNWLAQETSGAFDLLKVVSSFDPGDDERLKALYPIGHRNRYERTGLINEPCYEPAPAADKNRFGLWLDTRKVECIGDPFSDQDKYPGIRAGARGRNLAVGSLYGAPSGVIGLRLFANPDFDVAAAQRWDPVRYYTDPSYYNSPELIRPYRVGVTCALCHAGFDAAHPPDDPANPQWENLSSVAGSQTLHMEQLAHWQMDESSFAWQLANASRPGSLDTSLAISDLVFNPHAVNSLWGLTARMRVAHAWGRETLAGASRDVRQISNYVAGGPLVGFFEPPATVLTPRLGVGATGSAGVLAGIHQWIAAGGVYSQEALYHFHPLVGGKQSPLPLSVMRARSPEWRFSEGASPDIVRFLMDPGPAPKWTGAVDTASATRGRTVFAERCAACHSSKFPDPPPEASPGRCSGNYLECWERYWTWTQSPQYQNAMKEIAAAPDFLANNFLSNDVRVPLPVVGTNACSAVGGNGGAGELWDNFTSQTYKNLPSAGTVTWYHPDTGEQREWKLPAGGAGYLRPPSLIAVWASAPLLATNSIGRAAANPSAAERMSAFEEAMGELLWPERRARDSRLGEKIPGTIPRTTGVSRIRIPAHLVPEEFVSLLEGPLSLAPRWRAKDAVEIGPIPAGTPVGLLANLNLASDRALMFLEHLRKEPIAGLTDALLEMSTCPDLVMNRGHYFGTGLDGNTALSDAQKHDLIEFLKTL